MNMRMELKNKFYQVNDPILQRGEQYVILLLNYYQKINEAKPRKTSYPLRHHLATSEYEVK